MAYDAFVVDGSELAVKIASTFTLIPGVQTVSFSGAQKTEIEYTAISDTAKKFKGGKPDYGSITFDMAWDPADTTQAVILTAFNTAGSTNDFQLTCSDAGDATVAFSGSVMEWNLDMTKDTFGKVSTRVKLSGPIVVTP